MAEHMYSAEEAAQLLGLQVRTVRNYLREGRLPGVRIGKQYRIARVDLETFTAGVAAHGSVAGPEPRFELSPAPQPSAEASCVVQIDGIAPAARDELERTIMAATLSAQGAPSHLRVEPLYDEYRERLKLIVVGGLGETAELLRIIERFSPGGN